MKVIKGLLLGTAAGLVAMTGAQAADLPVKAKPVEYVKICSLYGAGFYYIPGTDTCIKFGGYLRVDVTANGNVQDNPGWNGSLGANDRFAHDFVSRSRLAFQVDTRTASQYGVVRTFGSSFWQFDTFSSAGLNTAAVAASAATGTINNYTPGNGYVAVDQVFLQFAGFTFGRSVSARAVPWNGFGSNQNTRTNLGGPEYTNGVNNIQYTQQWGNGVTTSIGVDEPVIYGRTNLGNVLAPSTSSAAAGASNVAFLGTVGAGGSIAGYAGQSLPDIVGNFKIDQAWGIFTVAGGIHEVKAAYYNNASVSSVPGFIGELSGHPGTKIGGSVTVGLQLKTDAIGTGDRFTIDATYARGDTRTVISTTGTSPNFAIFGQGIAGVSYQSVGFGFTSDGLYSGTNAANGSGIELTTSYGVRGGYLHNWSREWQSNLFGSYSRVDYNGTATALYCAQYVRITGVGSTTLTCNPDFSVAQIGLRTAWTPVTGLTFSGEVQYISLDQNFTGRTAGNVTPSTTVLAKPSAVYNFRDQDSISVNFRAQRNF